MITLLIKIIILLYGIWISGSSLIFLGAFIYHIFHGRFMIEALPLIGLSGIWGYGLLRRRAFSRMTAIVVNILLGLGFLTLASFPKIFPWLKDYTEYQLGIHSAISFWLAVLCFIIVFFFTLPKVKEQFR